MFLLIMIANACTDCGNGICEQNQCYCLVPFAGEQCDFVIQYQYGMNHTTSFEQYVGMDEKTGCQFNCSNHGLCQNDHCYCRTPYGGSYCQLKIQFIQQQQLTESVRSIIQKQQDLQETNVHNLQSNLTSNTSLVSVKQIDRKLVYTKCPVPCRHGGYCVYGMCMCPSPYVGDYCQYVIEFEYGTPHYQVWMLSIFCFLIGAALMILFFLILRMRDDNKKKYEIIGGQDKDFWEK